MRRQVRAAMMFYGSTSEQVDNIDEETFAEISVMYAEGMLGGRGVFDAIAPLTTAVFNYMREPKSPPYNSDKIFPWVNDYNINPDQEKPTKEKINDALLLAMTTAPGFSLDRFKNATRSAS